MDKNKKEILVFILLLLAMIVLSYFLFMLEDRKANIIKAVLYLFPTIVYASSLMTGIKSGKNARKMIGAIVATICFSILLVMSIVQIVKDWF